ncbi:MAG: gamma-glutamyltranspeptidase/glutathione hydrolase [Motiliproteus sp.]|jgi:gamma-glutamyltranspeptidase/glutathione hydrolase
MMMLNIKRSGLFVGLVVGLGVACQVVAAAQVADAIAPEQASGLQLKAEVRAQEFMVAAANPVAVEAGYQVLRRGGSAVDAMIAVQAMLGLVEPQSSGLGGGAFVVYYDAGNDKITTYDGRETAPLNSRPELFQDATGQPLKFYDAVVGGRSVGTPGTVKLMAALHQRYGNQPWTQLLKPAINQAREGFEVSPRLASAIAADAERLGRYPATQNYFFDAGGVPLAAGALLKNGAYADTLTMLAEQGGEAFYSGQIAADIVTTVQSAEGNPGTLALQDLATYQVKERPATCLPYKEYAICGMGPPSSGALTVGQILGITRHFDLSAMGADSAIAWQIIGDASRLAFADRGRYMADTDYVPLPAGLLDRDYLAKRARLITVGKALDTSEAGSPPWENPIVLADDQSIELPSTSHISIVDADGNALSMTTTIENGFGSRLMTRGFLLNNELTDFSFATHKDGHPIANRLEPGKRPRSSMSPTIVLRHGKPYLVLGSPGGSRIIGYVAKTLIAHLEWGMSVQEAISLPHLLNRFGTYDLEKGTSAEAFAPALIEMGFNVSVRDLNSGLHGIQLQQGLLLGGADPRREGVVRGD